MQLKFEYSLEEFIQSSQNIHIFKQESYDSRPGKNYIVFETVDQFKSIIALLDQEGFKGKYRVANQEKTLEINFPIQSLHKLLLPLPEAPKFCATTLIYALNYFTRKEKLNATWSIIPRNSFIDCMTTSPLFNRNRPPLLIAELKQFVSKLPQELNILLDGLLEENHKQATEFIFTAMTSDEVISSLNASIEDYLLLIPKRKQCLVDFFQAKPEVPTDVIDIMAEYVQLKTNP